MSGAGPLQAANAREGLRASAPNLPAQAWTARRSAGSDSASACDASAVNDVTSVGALK